MPYMRYSRKVWDVVKAQNPDLKLWEIGKIIGQMWRDLADDQKQQYIEAFEAEKVEYNDSLKSYHNSPAYQSWISAKAKAQRVVEDHNHPIDRHTTKSLGFPSPQKQTEGKVCIQSTEDDDENEEFSVKHLSTARYQRNHRLINEIFSESVVPDVRSVVTNARMQVLKRQVQSLTMHQKKLEAELQQIEEKFAHKKRKFIEASDQFKEEMRKKCATKPVDTITFQKMVEKALEQLKKEHQIKDEANAAAAEKLDNAETESQETVTSDTALEQHDSANSADSEMVSASEDSQELPNDTQSGRLDSENTNEDQMITTENNSGFPPNEENQQKDVDINQTKDDSIKMSSDSIESTDESKDETNESQNN